MTFAAANMQQQEDSQKSWDLEEDDINEFDEQ